MARPLATSAPPSSHDFRMTATQRRSSKAASQAWLIPAALAAGIAAVVACDRPTPQAPAINPDGPAAPAADHAATTAPSPEEAPVEGGAESAQAPTPTPTLTQQRLALQIVDAVDQANGPLLMAAAVSLSRNLGLYRANIEPELSDALRRATSSESRALWSSLDGGHAVPLAEALLEIHDFAAVLRVSEHFAGGATEAGLAGPRALATAWVDRPARVQVRGCDTPVVNGAPSETPEIALVAGSHLVACQSPEMTPRLIIVTPNEEVEIDLSQTD